MSHDSWTSDIFENLFRSRPDPWALADSPYERDKLAHLLRNLPERPVRLALELGCAIGVTTRNLASRCDRVVAVDAAQSALAAARQRCAGLENIVFREAFLPGGFPVRDAEGCDLIVVSEILYFLSEADVAELALRVMASAAPDAVILLVNWTGETDTPCTGDQAATTFVTACRAHGWRRDRAERRASYRLDRLVRPRT